VSGPRAPIPSNGTTAPSATGHRDDGTTPAVADEQDSKPPSASVGRQGTLLFSGFALSQAMSFARNALIGHWLSQGDFGIAATLTLMLQLVDLLSDVGVDRLITQASDGEEPRLQASCQLILIARGLITGLALYLAAGPLTQLFQIPDARWAFETISLLPVIKGAMHLDIRRFQRRLVNRPYILVEVLPQAATLAAMPVALSLTLGFEAIVWVAFVQACLAVVLSHALAARPYRLALDGDYLKRIFAFGWPIWLSAFPLVAVYQGDRILVGSLLGIEALAAFTTAFMITMVPGLIAGKVGHALMLPLLSAVKDAPANFAQHYRLMVQSMVVTSAAYVSLFLVAGGAILPIAFGPNYVGLSAVVSWLAVMWAMRMLQAVPGMALMADGDTRPFLIAGMIRATGLGLSAYAAYAGFGLAGMAAAGAISELMSLAYVSARLARNRPGLDAAMLAPALALTAIIAIGAGLSGLGLAALSPVPLILFGGAFALTAAVAACAVLAETRAAARSTIERLRQPSGQSVAV